MLASSRGYKGSGTPDSAEVGHPAVLQLSQKFSFAVSAKRGITAEKEEVK